MRDILRQLGFSENEEMVYTALVELGPCFVAPLVRSTKKHRQIVYNALESLTEKNYVTLSKKNGKNFYQVADPQRFIVEAKQKEVAARQLAKSVMAKLAHDQEKVEVFVGDNAFAKALADFRHRAEETQEYVIIGGDPGEWQIFTQPFFETHISELRRMKRQGIDIQVLFFENSRNQAKKHFYSYVGDPYSLRISKETTFPQTGWLAGDHVYIRTPVSDPVVIHVQSKALAASYRQYFESLWEAAEKIRI